MSQPSGPEMPPIGRERRARTGLTPVAGTLLALLLVAAAAPGSWIVLERTRPSNWASAATAVAPGSPVPGGSSGSTARVTAGPLESRLPTPSPSPAIEYGSGKWTPLRPLDHGVWGAGWTVLPDGQILVAGGSKGSTSSYATADVRLIDPLTGTWHAMTAMLQARAYPMLVTLKDGSVLVMGGSRAGLPLDSVERYMPDSDTWVAVNRMHVPRTHGTATLLPDGKVLVAGGGSTGSPDFEATASAELYDPSSGTWTEVPSMSTPRVLHIASLLPDGTVLVAGGCTTYLGSGTVQATAEIYDPAANAWHPTGSMNAPRYTQSAVALPDGRVLVAGGWSFTTNTDPSLSSAELYDPATGKWSATASMATGRAQFRMVVLADGRVLGAGGVAPNYSTLASSELYDPAKAAWTATGSLPVALMWPVLVATEGGRAYVLGGARDSAVKATSNVVAFYVPPPR